MALIDWIDGPNRRIYLSIDSVGASFNPVDIYKEMRALRRTDEALRKYDVFLGAAGNDPKGGGKFTERYTICLNGTRIVPYDVTHQLEITGTIITDDGQEGIQCFDRGPLTSTSRVDIAYIPPQVEVITLGGGAADEVAIADEVASRFSFTNGKVDANVDAISEVTLTAAQAAMLEEMWKLAGLDINTPMSVSPRLRKAGNDIVLQITREGEDVTVYRQNHGG